MNKNFVPYLTPKKRHPIQGKNKNLLEIRLSQHLAEAVVMRGSSMNKLKPDNNLKTHFIQGHPTGKFEKKT